MKASPNAPLRDGEKGATRRVSKSLDRGLADDAQDFLLAHLNATCFVIFETNMKLMNPNAYFHRQL